MNFFAEFAMHIKSDSTPRIVLALEKRPYKGNFLHISVLVWLFISHVGSV